MKVFAGDKFNPLHKRQILDSSKLKDFADDNIEFDENGAIKCRKYCGLTHYHTMPHFDARKIESCGKHCEKRRNCL